MILIAGGTGRLGTLLVERLAGRGHPVRILTRHPARAKHPTVRRVTMAVGDARDRASLAAASAGVDVVVSAMHGFTRRRAPEGDGRR